MMMSHAILAPSSAPKWVQCAGSVGMEQAYPEQESPKAAEGTLAHMVAKAAVDGQPFGFSGVTDEMLEGADIYSDHIRSVMASTSAMNLETRVDCPQIHADNWGTPDCWIIDRARRTIHIIDYKFGHRHVEVFENWQLINYAAGVFNAVELTGIEEQAFSVHLTIIQPRSYHSDGPIRTWSLSAVDLRGYFNQLKMAAEKATVPDAKCTTGSECQDCTARHACPALQAQGYWAIEKSTDAIPFDLPAGALGRELKLVQDAIERLKSRASGMEYEVLARIKQGAAIPGWMAQQGQGREKWAMPLPEVIALGQMMGVDISKPGAVTPKQAIKAGLPAELVKQYSETPFGEIKLVPDTVSASRRIFG